jgi:antitoxin (DNA-binding transcriptional repressor) of toxin-antitoxin stability system
MVQDDGGHGLSPPLAVALKLAPFLLMLQQLQQFGVVAVGVMSIREFNKNSSAAFAKVAAGETLDISKNGEVFAEIRPKRKNRMDDPEFRAKWEIMMASMRKGVPGLKGPFTYEERTER